MRTEIKDSDTKIFDLDAQIYKILKISKILEISRVSQLSILQQGLDTEHRLLKPLVKFWVVYVTTLEPQVASLLMFCSLNWDAF